MPKKITRFCFLFFAITLVFVLFNLYAPRTPYRSKDHEVIEFEIAGQKIDVEVAKSSESIQQGLGNRELLKTDGMLFVFSNSAKPIFWMKDMEFPIDLYWIKDEQIIGVERNLQPPSEDENLEDIMKYAAPDYVDMVLEIPVSKEINLSP